MEGEVRILVVEDLPEWQDKISRWLEEVGYVVDIAENLSAALLQLRRRVYDVAVVDIRLEEWDEENIEGMELVEEMAKLGATKDTAIVVLTAHGTLELARAAWKEYEVSDFINKEELDISDFVNAVSDAASSAFASRASAE